MPWRSTRRRKSLPKAWGLGAAALVGLAVLGGATYGPGAVRAVQLYTHPDRLALRAALEAPDMAALRPAYAARNYRPIWMASMRPGAEAKDLVARLGVSGQDGLRPEDYDSARLAGLVRAAGPISAVEAAQTELRLSRSYARYAADLHRPPPAADLVYTDVELRPQGRDAAVELMRLATAHSTAEGLAQGLAVNPLYAQYRQALAEVSRQGAASPALSQALRVNLERARALPAQPGPRFVLVDAAAGQLWMYENGRSVDSMKVVVGAPNEQTPAMAGMIRYAMFNPYWNIPADLTRRTYAPRIAADPAALNALQLDVWSDYTAQAHKLDPASIDWRAVARGTRTVWLRQRPGGQNMMGAVKFMLPNTLGIYLHDTPNRAVFARDQRALSAGCIRVEDYRRLAAWLYKGAPVGPKGDGADQRIDLPEPVPVYITYLTATPAAGSERRPDIYRRDGAVVAQLRT